MGYNRNNCTLFPVSVSLTLSIPHVLFPHAPILICVCLPHKFSEIDHIPPPSPPPPIAICHCWLPQGQFARRACTISFQIPPTIGVCSKGLGSHPNRLHIPPVTVWFLKTKYCTIYRSPYSTTFLPIKHTILTWILYLTLLCCHNPLLLYIRYIPLYSPLCPIPSCPLYYSSLYHLYFLFSISSLNLYFPL